MKAPITKIFNKIGVILICVGGCSIVFTHEIFLGVLSISFGYFLYLKND